MKKENKKEKPKKGHRGKKNSVQELLGIQHFTKYGLMTEHGELVFFQIAPTNISVLCCKRCIRCPAGYEAADLYRQRRCTQGKWGLYSDRECAYSPFCRRRSGRPGVSLCVRGGFLRGVFQERPGDRLSGRMRPYAESGGERPQRHVPERSGRTGYGLHGKHHRDTPGSDAQPSAADSGIQSGTRTGTNRWHISNASCLHGHGRGICAHGV